MGTNHSNFKYSLSPKRDCAVLKGLINAADACHDKGQVTYFFLGLSSRLTLPFSTALLSRNLHPSLIPSNCPQMSPRRELYSPKGLGLFKAAVPVWGINHSNSKYFVPETGTQVSNSVSRGSRSSIPEREKMIFEEKKVPPDRPGGPSGVYIDFPDSSFSTKLQLYSPIVGTKYLVDLDSDLIR